MNAPVLSRLQASDYDCGKCEVGVVHLGFGAFHRAHQAVYLDAFMQASNDLRWGIAAVNLRPAESEGFAKAAAKDGYVLKTVATTGETRHRLIRPHIAFEDWARTPDRAEALLARPSAHLATITVTESGYYLDDAGRLNLDDPVIEQELSGGTESSVYAFLRNALRRRREARAGPLTVLCCDNIRENGKMLSRCLRAYLDARGDRDLARWVDGEVSFPCSMVDRITPKPRIEDSQETRDLFGRANDVTIAAEDFIQWVVEDKFLGPRPELEQVGATITANVEPYEEAKIRILNGGHSCLAYLGALAGHRTFDEAMADPVLAEHFRAYEEREVLPALTIPLPFDKAAYLDKIADRFRNANIGDTIERICTDGYAKIPVFIKPTLEDCFKQGITPARGIFSVAGWHAFAKRSVLGRVGTQYHEPNMQSLTPLVSTDDLGAFIESEQLWGDMPRRFPEFGTLLASSVKQVESTWPE